MNDLIPESIAMWHDNYMIRLVETGVSKIIRKYRVAIAKNKGKFVCKSPLVSTFPYFVAVFFLPS